MSTFVNAMDNYTPTQIGENGSKEYAWSNSFKERILQLHFQLTRGGNCEILSQIYADLIQNCVLKHKSGLIIREEYIEYMSYLYRLIGQTRDIIDGKGEYALSYMLLNTWASYNIDLAQYALEHFVLADNDNSSPYGSWKDIKNIFKSYPNGPLTSFMISLVNTQLDKDLVSDNPSLLAKWIPREKSSHSELFTLLATSYYSHYITTAKTPETKKKAVLKAKMDYRKIISSLNNKLDTVQIKQCAGLWSTISPEKQTSITMHKQKKAFLNLTKNGSQRFDSVDRQLCAEHFTVYAEKAIKGEVVTKGKCVGLNDLVKEALEINGSLSGSEKDILNAQWINNSESNGALGKMIAMVDVSGSMCGEPLNAAIGLGLRIAEKSMLGKRVLTFSASPQWVNLEGIDKFTDMVKTIEHCSWGMNTNFAAALNMILDAIILNKLDAKDVEDMVLVILSDMQMDQADRFDNNLMESIEALYADAGIRVCGTPYKPPHILFWNLRSTSGFPTLSGQKNTSMMSGFSPALLNIFCEEGMNSLQSCTPWSLFVKNLDNKRYAVLDKKLRTTL